LRICTATPAVWQHKRSTGSFGSHRYGHGLRFTREEMAVDLRVRLASLLGSPCYAFDLPRLMQSNPSLPWSQIYFFC